MASVLINRNLKSVLVLLSSTIFLVACGDDSPSPQSDLVSESEVSNISEADIAIDTGIKAQVELALENASDIFFLDDTPHGLLCLIIIQVGSLNSSRQSRPALISSTLL